MWSFIETVKIDSPTKNHVVIRQGARKWDVKPLSQNIINEIKTLQGGIENFKITPKKIINFLKSEGLIFKQQNFPETQFNRTLHWLSYFHENAQDKFNKLQEKRVAIFGCGGTGAIIAEHLVRSGIQKILLVDSANVDVPDLNRQLSYDHSHLGRSKVNALAEVLQQINPNCEVECIQKKITNSEQVEHILKPEGLNIVVCCMDQPQFKIQSAIATAGAKLDVSVAFGAVGVLDGIVGPICRTALELLEMAEKFDQAFLLNKEIKTVRGSLAFTNTLIATHLGFEVFKYLLENTKSENKYFKPKLINF